MSTVPVLVLRTAGINCDEEVMHCWRLAGAQPMLLHLNELTARPALLDDFAILTIPGGFSYGDDIAAGTIFAQRIIHELADPLRHFVDRGRGILGICNGFQILVKAGLLPGGNASTPRVTVTYNDSVHFEARWVRMEVCTGRSPFLASDDADSTRRYLEMPVEHAEGKVVTADESVIAQLAAAGQIALRYVDAQGRHDTYPANPNGSMAGIAALTDPTGRILGLMPHPDRHFDHTHHPEWTRRKPHGPPDGLTLFLNAVTHWRE